MIFGYKINEEGFYTEKVLLENIESITDDIVIENISIGCIKPKWNGSEWEEGATPEEIQEWQDAQQPQPTQPTETEQLMLAIAELDAQREADKLETQLAIAELTNTILGGNANE